MILIGLCRRVPCDQTKSIPNLPHPPFSLSPSPLRFTLFGPFLFFSSLNCFSICDAGHVVRSRRRSGGRRERQRGERGGTRAPPHVSLRSDSSNNARASVGRTDHLTPRAVIIAKLKYERFLGDKGRFQHVEGRGGEEASEQQLQNFISPLLFCRPSAGLPGSLPSGSQDPNVNPRWAVLRSELEPQRSKSPEAGDLCLVLVRQ